MGHSDKVMSIHYLRVVAALMVVCMHMFSYGLVAGVSENPVSWMKHGVSIFFVISGFVAVVSTEKSPTAAISFLRRRLIRIAPLYWIATLLLVLVGLTNRGNEASLLLSLLFLPTPVPGADRLISPTLDVGWTLCLEVAFYLFFAASMALPRRVSVLGTAAALIAIGLVGPMLASEPWTRFYLSPRILEFGAGMLLAWTGLKAPWWLCPAGFVLLATLGGVTDNHTLAVSLPAILIVGGARGMDSWLRPVAFLELLGNASYALYLFHRHALALFVVPLLGRPAPMALLLPIGFTICVTVGVLFHRHVETPIGRALSARTKPAGIRYPIPA